MAFETSLLSQNQIVYILVVVLLEQLLTICSYMKGCVVTLHNIKKISSDVLSFPCYMVNTVDLENFVAKNVT